VSVEGEGSEVFRSSNRAKEVEIQKEKVEEVLNWPMLRNVKEVQKFLGLANYYRQFIKDFVKLVTLLHMLVRKKEK